MFFKSITLGSFQTNCYIVGSEDSANVVVVDPGAQFDLIKNVLETNCKIPQFVLLTHAHPDHYGALNELKMSYPKSQICMHKNDLPLYEKSELRALLGFSNIKTPAIDIFINNEDVLMLNDGLQIIVRHTPGHSPGGVCYLIEKMLFTGDTLFSGSVGRTDLPGGSFEMLMNSIHNMMENYSDDIKIYPGHGTNSSILIEKLMNPYLK